MKYLITYHYREGSTYLVQEPINNKGSFSDLITGEELSELLQDGGVVITLCVLIDIYK